MDDIKNTSKPSPAPPGSDQSGDVAEKQTQQPALTAADRVRLILIAIAGILILAGLVIAAIFLFNQGPEVTGQVRDIFLVFMVLEFLVIGAALIILIIQLAILTNLIQNEMRPILNATLETVNTLRGTTQFISDNLAEPIIKLNEYLAGVKKFLDIFRGFRK